MNQFPTSRQVDVLAAIRDIGDDRVSCYSVGARLQVAHVTAYKMMRSLEQKGLLERAGGVWALTETGREWLPPTTAQVAAEDACGRA